jgi:hypothetical protein
VVLLISSVLIGIPIFKEIRGIRELVNTIRITVASIGDSLFGSTYNTGVF